MILPPGSRRVVGRRRPRARMWKRTTNWRMTGGVGSPGKGDVGEAWHRHFLTLRPAPCSSVRLSERRSRSCRGQDGRPALAAARGARSWPLPRAVRREGYAFRRAPPAKGRGRHHRRGSPELSRERSFGIMAVACIGAVAGGIAGVVLRRLCGAGNGWSFRLPQGPIVPERGRDRPSLLPGPSGGDHGARNGALIGLEAGCACAWPHCLLRRLRSACLVGHGFPAQFGKESSMIAHLRTSVTFVSNGFVRLLWFTSGVLQEIRRNRGDFKGKRTGSQPGRGMR